MRGDVWPHVPHHNADPFVNFALAACHKARRPTQIHAWPVTPHDRLIAPLRSLQKNPWAALTKLWRLSPMRPLHMPLVTLTVVARSCCCRCHPCLRAKAVWNYASNVDCATSVGAPAQALLSRQNWWGGRGGGGGGYARVCPVRAQRDGEDGQVRQPQPLLVVVRGQHLRAIMLPSRPPSERWMADVAGALYNWRQASGRMNPAHSRALLTRPCSRARACDLITSIYLPTIISVLVVGMALGLPLSAF